MGADTPATQDKQVTIAVPEDRVPEFYAFYARFLAGGGRRGRGRGGPGHGPGGHRGPGCRVHQDAATGPGDDASGPPAPAAPAT